MKKKIKHRQQKPAKTTTAIIPAQAHAISVPEAIEKVLIQGDLAALTTPERIDYYKRVCNTLGLNPLTRPFDYILFREGDNSPAKLSLYANKSCSEQLRKIHGVSVIPPLRREMNEDICMVEADVRDHTGRTDSATGSVALFKYKDGKRINLAGKELCNAIMKCETKAKRRATLSICGLAFLDESELDTMQVLGGVTPEGRIYYNDGADAQRGGSREAAQRVLAEKLAPKPNQAEIASHGPPVREEPAQQKPAEAPKEYRGTVEIDQSIEADPIVRGDLGDLVPLIEKHCTAKFHDGWWHILPRDMETMRQMCEQIGYKLVEILPKSTPPPAKSSPSHSTVPAKATGAPSTDARQKPKPASANPAAKQNSAGPVLVKGIIERVFTTTTQNKAPMRQVTILMPDKKKPTFGCFDKALFDYLDKAKGEIEAYVTIGERYNNLVGLKRIITTAGVKEFDLDGKTPVIQRKDQEAGARTLFGA